MKKISEPIVFFGSGPVAADSLRLLATYANIEAVITKPRPLHHKGDVPVLRAAEDLSLPIYSVDNKKSLDTLFSKQPIRSTLGILIDFGIIVSQAVIDYFPKGIINSHFSLLPEWRGADPITFSILSGQQQTGVSLMLLTAGMDEGPLLAQAPYSLPVTITTPELTSDLIALSDSMLQHIVPLWQAGKTEAMPQEQATIAPSATPTYSRKLSKKDGIIDWSKDADVIEREVRAFAGWPNSRSNLGIDAIIVKSHVINRQGKPGSRDVYEKKPLVYCGSNALVLDIIKPAGKREMTGEAFLSGYKKLFLSLLVSEA